MRTQSNQLFVNAAAQNSCRKAASCSVGPPPVGRVSASAISAMAGRDIDDVNIELYRKKLQKMEDNQRPLGEKIGQFWQNFQEELDAFADDAVSHRLGNGARFYGKRKSNFYGTNDTYRKKNKFVFDPKEDY